MNFKDFDQKKKYFLSDAISFPPTHGETDPQMHLTLTSFWVSIQQTGKRRKVEWLQMEEDYGNWSTRRIIARKDILAIYVPKNWRKIDWSSRNPKRWFFGEEARTKNFTTLNQTRKPPKGIAAILYVPESARVLMRLRYEAGVNAAESAHYCPAIFDMAEWGCGG